MTNESFYESEINSSPPDRSTDYYYWCSFEDKEKTRIISLALYKSVPDPQNPDVVLLPFHDSRVIEFLRPRNRASALG